MSAPERERFIVRLPDGLRDEIRATAEQNGRSMNAEIVLRLEGHTTNRLRLDMASRILAGMASNPAHNETDHRGLARASLIATDVLIAMQDEPLT